MNQEHHSLYRLYLMREQPLRELLGALWRHYSSIDKGRMITREEKQWRVRRDSNPRSTD